MTKKEFRTLDGFAIDLGESSEDGSRWHKIALEGKWDGHWMGAFSLNSKMFDESVDHFKSLSNDTLVDYEHASVFKGKAPAAGWIKALETRPDETGVSLYAKIEWTKKATDHIKSKEYRYLSPTVLFKTKDRKTGEPKGASIHSVALTNTPFLDELPEVRLNSFKFLNGVSEAQEEKEAMNKEQLSQLCDALGLSETSSVEEVIEGAKAISLSVKSAENSITALKAKNEELVLDASEIAELRKSAARAVQLEADARVKKATDEGKITATNQEWALKLALSNGEAFDEWSACALSIVPVETVKKPESQRSESSINQNDIEKAARLLSTDQIESIKNLGLNVEDYLRFNPEEVTELLCR